MHAEPDSPDDALDDAWTERFGGVDRLYGRGALKTFSRAHVAVVGLGGVGSWVVEALARSGVGRFTLIDADDLCVSNTNRQLPALAGQYGRGKADAMAERCRAINPAVAVDSVPNFLTPGNLDDHARSRLRPRDRRLRQLSAPRSKRSRGAVAANCR
jgi:tRNA A37 threonylcarbamoyladenosine dehydratase